MAGNSTIGALRVVLGADTASFENGMKGAAVNLKALSKQAAIAGAAIGAALSGAIIGLGVSIKNAIDQADNLDKLAQSVGVPVEELSKLRLAADLSGVSIESLGRSFGTLNRNMVYASGNIRSEAARAFTALGISLKDANGNLKAGSAVLTEIAGKFQGYQDGVAKSALATAIFGGAGAKLIPLLNEGAEGLQRMMQQADEFGLTIDTKTAKAASAFNDNLTLMGKIWDGIVVKVTAALLPAFQQLSGAMLEAGRSGSLMTTVANSITNAIQGAVTIAITGYTAFERLGAEFTALMNLLKSDNLANTKVMWQEFVNEGNETQAALKNLGPKIKQFWDDAAAAASRTSITINKSTAPVIAGVQKVHNAVDSFLASQAKRGAQLQAEAATLTLTTAAQQAYRIQLEAETIAKEKNIPLTDALRQKILDSAKAYGAIAEATERAKERFNQLRQTGEQVGGAIAGVFQDWITKGGKFGDVLKNLAAKIADIAFQVAVTKPLQNIFGSLFSGAAMKPLFGFASGGSFDVGGSGGIDSQLVAFKASPNERVSVTKPGQSAGGGGSTIYAPQYHFSPGMTPADMASIRAQMAMADKATEERTIGRIRRAHQTDSGFLNG